MSKHFFLYAIVGLIFAGFLFSRTKASGPKQKSGQYAEPVQSPDGVYSLGAVRLWRDYEQNEVAADIRYKGQRLSVTGTIVSIERDYEGRPVLRLFGGNAIFPIVATLNKADIPAVAQLKKGGQIVVRCIGAGREMRMPQLERCLML
jgi:putative nucleic acid binding protein